MIVKELQNKGSLALMFRRNDWYGWILSNPDACTASDSQIQKVSSVRDSYLTMMPTNGWMFGQTIAVECKNYARVLSTLAGEYTFSRLG